MDDWLLTRVDLLPTFSSEGASPKYVVALQDAKAVGGEGALPMKDKYGRPYSCSIPDTTQHDQEAQGATPKVSMLHAPLWTTYWHGRCKHTASSALSHQCSPVGQDTVCLIESDKHLYCMLVICQLG